MYKVIVVSEYAITRIGISYSIFWEKYGYTVVGNAANFKEMMVLIKSEQPDLIFIEINDKSTQQVNLTEIVKLKGIQCELIVIGSSDDKNYINKVLDLGALDYIEKKYFEPIKIVEKLDYYKDILSEKNKDILKDNKEISKDIMLAAQSQILKELLYGRRNEAQLNPNILKLYGVYFSYNNFVVMMTKIRNNGESMGNRSTLRFFQEIVEEGGITYICNSSLNELSFIYNFRVTEQREQSFIVNEMAKRILSIIKKYYQVNATIFISGFHEGINNIPLAYLQSCQAFKMKQNVLSSPFVYYDELKSDGTVKIYESLDNYVDELDIALKETDEVKIKYISSRFINEIHRINYIELSHLKYVLSAVTYVINDYIETIGCDLGDMWGKDLKPYVIIENLENKNDFIEFIQHMGEKLVKIVTENKESNIYIKKMKDYVKTHYTEEVNIKKVANEIGLTTSYMSTLFKKNTGQTYKDYLINYRLLKAKELLSTTTMQVATISQKIGYDNENYFSKMFKLKTGVTPSSYRNKYYK
ncbi:DNA-binding response regulator [Clostridium grantii]|uniref:Stage 0 sporulation protein A homolog n=1 Tax=Clostridium grantii DSM 8605 TaxID=1121316 RepID=A0A1M5WA74_9CLOT|nr:helix-turn-helix domain-containing protein [Clostridium grantii]SHH84479.1 AraC-type DNA-binding protein [Clostridium grantii DSM 8605]